MAGVEPLPIVRACNLEITDPEANWLVNNLWPSQGVGIIGGQPKLGKSWLGLDLAISVASGTPCLGHFPVRQKGPTLVFLAEDGLSAVRARIEAICGHRKIDMSSLDLHVITIPVLRLDVDEQRQRLQASLASLRPRLLLLDPLVRLHRLDENSAQDVSMLLGFLREIQRTCELSIALVHHAGKKHYGRAGQSLRGSSDLHAFVDTLAWLGGTQGKLELQLEHRSAPSPEPMRLRLVSLSDGSHTHLELLDNLDLPADPAADLSKKITDLLGQAGTFVHRADLRKTLRVNNQRLGEALTTMERQHRVIRGKAGWGLPKPGGHRGDDAQMTLL